MELGEMSNLQARGGFGYEKAHESSHNTKSNDTSKCFYNYKVACAAFLKGIMLIRLKTRAFYNCHQNEATEERVV